MFEGWDRTQKFQLYFIRQTGGDPVYIILACVASFWFEKDLMGCPIRKLHDFVFDGWAISRASPLNPSGIERRSVEVCPNDFVRLRGCVGNPTWHLFHVEPAVRKKI